MIRAATPADVPVILAFIRELAAFEREPDAVAATEPMLAQALFGETPAAEGARRSITSMGAAAEGAHRSITSMGPAAEALIVEVDGVPVGFAVFFHNFSTWTGRRGLYLEDLYVKPAARGRGVGKALLRHLAGLAVERDCARFEWSVLDWNADAIAFYRSVGAIGMEEWTVQRLSGDALARLAAG